LRGEEISKIEQTRILKHFEEGGTAQQKHVRLLLVGRFKQVEGEQHHVLPVAAVTGYGIKIREWVGRLLEEKKGGWDLTRVCVSQEGRQAGQGGLL
jgi:hypothetical protein